MAALVREIRAGSTLTDGSRNLALGLLLAQRLVSKIAVPSPPGARYARKNRRARRRGERRRDRSRAGPELRVGRAGRGGRGIRGGARVGAAARSLRAPRPR